MTIQTPSIPRLLRDALGAEREAYDSGFESGRSHVFAPAWRTAAARIIGGRKAIETIADRTWTIHAAETTIEPPALFDPRQLERVTAVQENTTMAAELDRLRGGPRTHGATKAYGLSDAVLHSGRVYAGPLKLTIEHNDERRPLHIVADEVDGDAVLATTYVGNRYFGHSLSDDIPLNLLASDMGTAVRTAQPLTQHQSDYRRLAQVDAHALGSAHFKNLIVVEDHAQNRSKRERCALVRQRFQAGRAPSPHAGVLLLRGETGTARVLRNEDALRCHLERHGFVACYPERMSADELLEALAHAPIVIGVEGSQLAHAIFSMEEGGTMIVLQPPYRFNNVYKDRCEAFGLEYGIVVGHEVEGGFLIDIDEVMRLLDCVR